MLPRKKLPFLVRQV